jgi:hypothetical protein
MRILSSREDILFLSSASFIRFWLNANLNCSFSLFRVSISKLLSETLTGLPPVGARTFGYLLMISERAGTGEEVCFGILLGEEVGARLFGEEVGARLLGEGVEEVCRKAV